MSGFTFESEMKAARYASAIQYAILTHDTPLPGLTDTCPECGETVDGWNTDHILGVDREENVYVIIGCEGYWVIDPKYAMMDNTNWSDGSALGDEVTGVHDGVCAGNHPEGAPCTV